MTSGHPFRTCLDTSKPKDRSPSALQSLGESFRSHHLLSNLDQPQQRSGRRQNCLSLRLGNVEWSEDRELGPVRKPGLSATSHAHPKVSLISLIQARCHMATDAEAPASTRLALRTSSTKEPSSRHSRCCHHSQQSISRYQEMNGPSAASATKVDVHFQASLVASKDLAGVGYVVRRSPASRFSAR